MVGNALWHLVMQSDFITKIVLGVLLIMMILCYTVFLYKLIPLFIKKRHMRALLSEMKKLSTFEDMRVIAHAFAHTIPGYFLGKGIGNLKVLLEASEQIQRINDQEFEFLQQQLGQTVDEIMHNEESSLMVLSTSAAVAPLLGLFGTVWGLIHAFLNISQQQSADIATVAPGIAEALITTLVGLIVAIPALVMYHYLLAQLRTMEYQLSQIGDMFELQIKRAFIKR